MWAGISKLFISSEYLDDDLDMPCGDDVGVNLFYRPDFVCLHLTKSIKTGQ